MKKIFLIILFSGILLLCSDSYSFSRNSSLKTQYLTFQRWSIGTRGERILTFQRPRLIVVDTEGNPQNQLNRSTGTRGEEVPNNSDTLVVGKSYNFGTKQNRQYTGRLIKTDSVYYFIKSDEGIEKIKTADVTIFREIRGHTNADTTFSPEIIVFMDTSTLVKVILKDNTDFLGYVFYEDTIKIVLKTQDNSDINIPKASILKIEKNETEKFETGRFMTDPNDARLLLGPTARPIRKNHFIISDVEVFFPMIGYGIEDIGSIMGGVSVFPSSKVSQLIYVNAKITPFRFQYGDVAAGLIYFRGTDSNTEALPIVYGGATLGIPEISISAGTGIAIGKYSHNEMLILLGGEVRFSQTVKLISENWIFTNNYIAPLSLLGLRIFDSNFAFDFGVFRFWMDNGSSEWHIPYVFPYISFTHSFNLNK